MFLGFTNFYKGFIRNFNRIVAPLISIFRTTDDEILSTQATENKKNQDVPSGDTGAGDSGNIKNLLTTTKSAKSKKPKLTITKKSDFAKANSFGTDFLTPEAKKTFIHLQKTFTKAPILRHFDLECHI